MRSASTTSSERRTEAARASRSTAWAKRACWDLDELKIEFEELILAEAPIEIAGFTLDEIDQIVLGDELAASIRGRSRPSPGAVAVARLGDTFRLGRHRLVCGDATDPERCLRRLMDATRRPGCC